MTADRYIILAHGNGGRLMRELIDDVFARHLDNPELDTQTDAARLILPQGDVLITTDGFTVQPLEFPGGDIGSLAVHGTSNDLAVAGADPLYMTLNAFIEEGCAFELLERLVASMASAARADSIRIVAGDTKVLRRSEASGVYFATTGVGIRPKGLRFGLGNICDGDRILVSGPVGDHGAAVLLAREDFGLKGALRSDAASVLPLTRAIRAHSGVRFMRDPTRGGLATVMHDIARATGLGVLLQERMIPVHQEVSGICDILGYDPMFLACEGRVVAVAAPEAAPEILAAWRCLPLGADAAEIGRVEKNGSERVILDTAMGGQRVIEELEDDPLPRIC